MAVLEVAQPNWGQLQSPGAARSLCIGQRNQTRVTQSAQHVTQRLPGDKAQPGKFGGRRVGVIVQSAQQCVLRHRQPGRFQRGIATASQALLNPLDQTARAPLVTLINVFTVDPERSAELAELLRVATEEKMQFVPGFISANIHLSTDGTRVVNYAQWQSTEAYQELFEDPSAREHIGACAAIATSFEPHLYTVESVHHAPNV